MKRARQVYWARSLALVIFQRRLGFKPPKDLAGARTPLSGAVDHVRDTILERVRSDPSSPALVVLELSATLYVDTHSSHMLAELGEDLAVMGVRVRVVEARSSVRDCLRGEGVDEKLGKVNRFTSVDDAIEEGSAG